MSTIISTASTLFSTTTGFAYADLVTWVGDILKLLLGGGLGLINATMGWIIALVIIGVIIHFIRRGFHFFHF